MIYYRQPHLARTQRERKVIATMSFREEREERNAMVEELALDLAKIVHRQSSHEGSFEMCPSADCRHRFAVLMRGEEYCGPTAADLTAMGEIRHEPAVAGV